jgi:hypothetical protein
MEGMQVSTGQIDFQDVLALVELIKASSNFSEIRLRSGDVEIELRRNGGAGFDTAPPQPLPPCLRKRRSRRVTWRLPP